MVAKRIIACFDIKNGRIVKGVNFTNLQDAGDPVELSVKYANEGIDELVFLDINASYENRKTVVELAKRVGQGINIPFAIGGGISDLQTAYELLQSGADKVSINTAAIRRPNLVKELSDAFGSQAVIVAIDAKCIDNRWLVHSTGGRVATQIDLLEWAQYVADLGAGEILFTSMDHDGSKNGFAIEVLQELNNRLTIPVIASGGAGKMEHFLDAFLKGKADAVLAASVFHYGEIPIGELKKYLLSNNLYIRP
jgi:cyclase